MPLVRFEVRNEYGLGLPELYKEANREDPKAVLDGVAVAGLVGILRQLGDLAEFAAEVFHGLQEQVTTTASRSQKLKIRVQHIEAALPLVEKAILAQTSHLHFCYTAGSDWHARIQNEQNHFIYNDLPRFIMDSYEECRDPPRLHLLDKFDSGGPGSCLRRYSDPTFFKRVSVSSDEAKAVRAQRDKKAHKSKKKRSWHRNGEVSHGASISNGGGRMQFASPNVCGQTSPAQSVSTIDTTLKSDLGDHSHSFDSRTGSGFIECVFHLSSSMQPEEQEPKESSSSRLTMQHNDTVDSDFLDEQTKVEDDDFPRSSLQEQTAPSSSCVTWDEKTEIVEPEVQQCDSSDEAPEVLPTSSCIDTQERGAVNLRNVDQMDIPFDVESTPRSISGGNQLDEIESETDNYMDALNTIESESENDFDCQTKREVEQYSSKCNNSDIEDGVHEITAHNSDHCPSNFESQTASYCSSNKEMSWDLPNSVSSESFTPERSPQIAGRSYPDSSPNIDLCKNGDILDGSKLESVIGDPSSSGSSILNSQDQLGNKVISSVCESQESLAEFSGINSIKFWTNGGLLGLEPSKPPDISVSNAVSQDSVTGSKDDTISPSGHTVMLKDGGHTGKPSVLVKSSKNIEEDPSSKCSTSCDDDQEDGTSIKKKLWGISPVNSDAKLERSGDSHHNNRFNHAHGRSLNEASVMTPGTELPVTSVVKVTSTEANQENDENSSLMFGLSQRLLVNGFRRKVSLVHDDKSEPANCVKSGVFDNKSGHHNVPYKTSPDTTFKEQFGNGSAVNSLSSSPPLEHMKISFHPTNSFETSKLKLKFPDGSHCQEFVRDMFPSFQLVPEPVIPLHDIGSDSDDDTFCRSSPYMSDDCLSHHSESNSEQWDTGETQGSNDPELYDTLCRISLTESISSSLELEGTPLGIIRSDDGLKSPYIENGVEPSQSGPLLDLPSFDAVNPSLHPETKYDSAPKDLLVLQYPKEPMPPPPPLPPMQWRVLNSHSDVAGDKQDVMAEARSDTLDLELLESTVSQHQPKPEPTRQQPPKPDSTKRQQIIEEAIAFKPRSMQQDEQKLNGQKEANQAANGGGVDEKEDFLNQIRTKSFNLRRTVTARLTFTPAPTANIKVSAILEKANAIRQAVGSDDGEDDDNWSDT